MLQSLSRRTLTNSDILLLVLIWTLTQIHFHPRTSLIVTFLLAIYQLQTRTLARRCIYLMIRTLNVLFRYLVLLQPYLLPTNTSISPRTLLVPISTTNTQGPQVSTFKYQKYRPVAHKIRPVIADLPDKY